MSERHWHEYTKGGTNPTPMRAPLDADEHSSASHRIAEPRGQEREEPDGKSPSVPSFGARLVAAMKREKVSNIELARAVGVSYNTVSRWRQGAFMPRQSDIIAIADKLRMSPKELHYGTGDAGEAATEADPVTMAVLGSFWHTPDALRWIANGVEHADSEDFRRLMATTLRAMATSHQLRLELMRAERE